MSVLYPEWDTALQQATQLIDDYVFIALDLGPGQVFHTEPMFEIAANYLKPDNFQPLLSAAIVFLLHERLNPNVALPTNPVPSNG